MTNKPFMTINDCMKVLKQYKITTSRITFMKWMLEYEFGEQLLGKGSNWIICPNKFNKFLNTKFHKKNAKKKRKEK